VTPRERCGKSRGDDVEVEMSYEALPEIPDIDLSDLKLEAADGVVSDDIGYGNRQQKRYDRDRCSNQNLQ